MSILGGVICFAMFCVTLYLIFKPKSNGSGCDSDNSGRNSNQSTKEAMMSRARVGLLNLNDTVSTPKDTLDLVKQGCDVQIVATEWSYVKSINHSTGGSGSNDINVSHVDKYFDRCDRDEEISTRPRVGGKLNDSSRSPEYHKKDQAPKKEKETPKNDPPADQNVVKDNKGRKASKNK
jgi:hypothetical protein